MADTYQILHVDDDTGFLDLTASFLEESNSDLDVKSTTDPEEALNQATGSTVEIDCVISDYQMPQMTGIDLLESIHNQNPNFNLPFILLTGEGNEEIAAEALNSGATSYIQKGGPDVYEYVAQRIRHDIQQATARRNSQRFTTLVEALGDPVYVLDSDGTFQFVNEAFLSLTGYSQSEVLGSTPSLIKEEQALAAGERQLGRILSAEGPDSVRFEIDVQPKDGDAIPCEDRMTVLPFEGDRFQGSLGVLRDISQRRQREERLADVQDQYRLLVEQSLVGLYLARDAELIYHNGRFAHIFEYPDQEDILTGSSLLELVQPKDRQRLSENLQRVTAGNTDALRQPFVGATADGSQVNVELLVRSITLEGRPATIGTVVSVGEAAESYYQVRRERDRLEEFTSIVSHDLRGPMEVARGQLELAQQIAELDDETSSRIDKADQALSRMDELLTDLLALAKEGAIIESSEPVSVSDVAQTTWQNIDSQDAALSVEATGTISADRSRLKGLFENLYRNAIDHGGSSVSVTVGDLIGESEEQYGFFVADDGPGIPPDDRGPIFESGYTTSEDGTGFGLSIVEEIVEAHGWKITVTESTTGGARFEIHTGE